MDPELKDKEYDFDAAEKEFDGDAGVSDNSSPIGQENDLYNKDSSAKPKGASALLSALKNGSKKKYIIGAAIPITLIILILFLMSALKIPNYAANIAAFRLSRAAMQYTKASSAIDAEKAAIDSADDGMYSSIKRKYGSLRDSTWGKLDEYRPNKLYKNMKASDRISYVYKDRKILGVNVPKLEAVVIDGEKIPINEKKFGRLWSNYKERIRFSAQIDANVDQALRGRSSLIRSRVANEIREAYGIRLMFWEKLGRNYQGLKATEADRLLLRDNEKNLKSEAKNPPVSEDMKTTATEVETQVSEDIADDVKATEMLENGGITQEASDVATKGLERSTFSNVFRTVVGLINPVYDIAVPACLIYDGSMYKPGGDIDQQSEGATKAYYALSTAGDQQKAGDTTAEAVGAFNRKLEDRYGAESVVDQYASGNNPDTTLEKSPQSNMLSELSIAGALLGNNTLTTVVDSIGQTVCPQLTDVWKMLGAGLLLLIGRVVAAIISGGYSEVGTETGKVALSTALKAGLKKYAVKTFEKRIDKVILEKLSSIWEKSVVNVTEKGLIKGFIKTAFPKGGFARKFARDFALIETGTFISKMIVLHKAGLVNDPVTYYGTDYINLADMGGDLQNNDLNRKMFYGAPMKDKDIAKDDARVLSYFNEEQKNASIYNRYFALNNQRSLAYKYVYKLARIKYVNIKDELINLLNITKLSLANFLRPNYAYANSSTSSATAHYGIVQWGWTNEENSLIESDESYGVLENARILTESGKIPEIQSKYGKCFGEGGETMGTLLEKGLIKRTEEGNITDEGDCSPVNLGIKNQQGFGNLVFRYRVYKMYENTLEQNLGIQNPTASATTISGTATGDCSGLNLGPSGTHKGGVSGNYTQYQLPNAEYYNKYSSGEYQWGRQELVETIYQVAKRFNTAHPNVKISVGDMDAANGSHVSHRNGVDVDISGCPLMISCGGSYDKNLSLELMKMFLDSNNIDLIIYEDPYVQNAGLEYIKANHLKGTIMNAPQAGVAVGSHTNHFHVRILPGAHPKGCE